MTVILARMKLICGNNPEKLNSITDSRYLRSITHLEEAQTQGKYLSPLDPSYITKSDLKRMRSKLRFPTKKVAERIRLASSDRMVFFPCSHRRQCSKTTNCSCIARNVLCTKECIWGKYGDNLFPGCKCTSHGCNSEFCECLLANRECDPDICACTCCVNNHIRMNKRTQLLVAKSTIPGAGWGLFTRSAVKQGDFLGEVSPDPLHCALLAIISF